MEDSWCLAPTYLDKPKVLAVRPEALPAEVQAVLPDQPVPIAAHSAAEHKGSRGQT